VVKGGGQRWWSRVVVKGGVVHQTSALQLVQKDAGRKGGRFPRDRDCRGYTRDSSRDVNLVLRRRTAMAWLSWWTDGWMQGCRDGSKEGWMMDGWMMDDGWMDEGPS
jgi:hypothetical protein